MIIIDVQIPFLDESFDFEVNEDEIAENVFKIVLQLLYEKKNNSNLLSQKFYFYAVMHEMILNPEDTLKHQGIMSGEKLLLV